MAVNLRLGDQGVWVQYLQLALQRAGYRVRIDGILGPTTCRALQAFFREENKCNVTESEWERLIPFLKGYDDRTIRRGDTLWNIAARYGTNVEKIIRANPGIQPDALQEGEVIHIPYGFPVVSTEVNYTYPLVQFQMEGLQIRYPFIKQQLIGKSVMGKEIKDMQIGTGKKEIFYSAAYHANEWITVPVLMKFAEDYADSYARRRSLGNENASVLFQEYSLHLVPLVNPDGVDLVNGILENDTYYEQAEVIAAEYPEIPFPDGWKANINGVDLNLQFPADWELAREIKFAEGYNMPAPRDYVGPMPLSEPESRAVYDFTRAHDFLLILAYHSQGEVIYWKYKNYNPKNSEEIAEYFGEVSGYAVEETPEESGNAGYKDWFIESYNRPGYTIEVGLGENPLSMEQFPKIYRDNFGILVGGMTQI